MNATRFIAWLQTAEAEKRLRAIYPAGDIENERARYSALAQSHRDFFGDKEGLLLVSAPGRTEIAGNHTDHNHGRVLAASINLDTVCAIAPNDTGIAMLRSEGYERLFLVDLSDLSVRDDEKETSLAIIRGVAARMKELGYEIGGFNAVVTSTVLKGSGLSSSAAFEVMLAAALDALYNKNDMDPLVRAKLCQYAENRYFDKPCGLLDQAASSVGGLVTMDFKSEEVGVEALSYDFESKGYALAVVSAGGDHGNLTADYAAIPAEMKQVARALGGEYLRDIEKDVFLERIPAIKNKVPDRAILRAMHFYDEDERVPMLVSALKNDDLDTFFAGIIASGESSWKLLQNIYVPARPNQEMALALAMSEHMLRGKGAWRIHGGGFAGTILAFVPLAMMDEYTRRMNAVFGKNAVTRLSVRPVGPAVLNL
ncbi:MAG: galactokinase [Christensenellales bacterium]|jgi:galactokinase